MNTLSGNRSKKELRLHYEVEKELAKRLRNSSCEERHHLYSILYDELYQRVPHHPQIRKKASPELEASKLARRSKLLSRYLNNDSVFMEIGAGSGSLSLKLAKTAKQVFAVDVSAEIAKDLEIPPNMKYLISDGCSIPVSDGSVDLAFSDQLIEHLHPDDVVKQLKNIFSALRPGGIHICLTPNRLNGPHDISQYFSMVAEGFHLKEYTNSELKRLFKDAGFSKISVLIGARGTYIKTPCFVVSTVEKILSCLPCNIRRRIADTMIFRVILGCRIFALK
ncbi:MAG: methyltransferase domain-containing protein [Candidatus Krumholzibacteriota bacterium]|nr:methyltransferase domain-containing protein [Candidatus Krumholzibacteriota bacterium]